MQMVLGSVGCTIGLIAAWFITSPLPMFLFRGCGHPTPSHFVGTAILLLLVRHVIEWAQACDRECACRMDAASDHV